MTLQEINEQSIEVDGIRYTPKTKCIRLESGEADYEIIKSAQEVYEEIKNKQIDICSEPTDKERIIKLEEEKSILAENVYQLAGIIEIMLGGTEDGQTTATTTDTTN